jgi:hypothetical protein
MFAVARGANPGTLTAGQSARGSATMQAEDKDATITNNSI